MSTAEELTTAINAKGEEIRVLKAAKPPDMKEQLAPLVAELLALKVSFKEVTGEDFGGAKPVEEKKKKEEQPAQPQREGPSKAELNKLKRKEAKLEKRAEAKGGDGAAAEPAAAAGPAPVAGTVEGDEALAHLYGDSPLVCSKTMSDKAYRNIAELSEVRLLLPLFLPALMHRQRAAALRWDKP